MVGVLNNTSDAEHTYPSLGVSELSSRLFGVAALKICKPN